MEALKSNFKKVMEFNRAFDMVPLDPLDYFCYIEDSKGNIKCDPLKHIRKDMFKDLPSTIKLRLDLIKEEIGELNEAILQNDLIEQRDACADILYVVYGMADVLGIAIDDYFNMNLNKHIDTNLDYYINNKLSSEFVLKTNLNSIDSIDTNSIDTNISNFNKVKLIKNKILEIDISRYTNLQLIDIIYYILNKTYLDLENNCIKKDNDYYNDEIITNKFELVANNLNQLLKLAYLMTYVIGADADVDFTIVHNSNMSKLCDNVADAKATVEDYKIKYISGTSPYDTPYFYHLPTLNKWIIKNLSTGKALKNIKYKKVNFSNPRYVF